jgi:hypothetical protein
MFAVSLPPASQLAVVPSTGYQAIACASLADEYSKPADKDTVSLLF